MASAILFAGVLAVISAIVTGQQQAVEAQLQVEAMNLAESKLDELVRSTYTDVIDADGTWLVHPTQLGFLRLDVTVDGDAANPIQKDLGFAGVVIGGVDVTVTVKDVATNRILVDTTIFVTEPQP